jgi:hypothetical protein
MATPIRKSREKRPRSAKLEPESALPRVRINWSEKELASLAKLLRSEPAEPTDALVRAMKG